MRILLFLFLFSLFLVFLLFLVACRVCWLKVLVDGKILILEMMSEAMEFLVFIFIMLPLNLF